MLSSTDFPAGNWPNVVLCPEPHLAIKIPRSPSISRSPFCFVFVVLEGSRSTGQAFRSESTFGFMAYHISHFFFFVCWRISEKWSAFLTMWHQVSHGLPSLSKSLTHPLCPGRFCGSCASDHDIDQNASISYPRDFYPWSLGWNRSVSFLPQKVWFFHCDSPWNQVTKCSYTIKSGKSHRGTTFGIYLHYLFTYLIYFWDRITCLCLLRSGIKAI